MKALAACSPNQFRRGVAAAEPGPCASRMALVDSQHEPTQRLARSPGHMVLLQQTLPFVSLDGFENKCAVSGAMPRGCPEVAPRPRLYDADLNAE